MREGHGSRAGFDLLDESTRSPDAACISEERIAMLPEEETEIRFMEVAPDFLIEVRPWSDSLEKLKTKMQNAWMGNGVRLAWLIAPYEEKAYLYREFEDEPEIIAGFAGKNFPAKKCCQVLSCRWMR